MCEKKNYFSLNLIILDGDHDSGVDETTQNKIGRNSAGGATPGNNNKPRGAPGSAPGGAGARSRPGARPGAGAASAGAARRNVPRSQSVPKPFSTYGTPSLSEKKGNLSIISSDFL